jgi:hypothetical protein
LVLQENPYCRRQYSKDIFFIGGNKGSVGDKERHMKRNEVGKTKGGMKYKQRVDQAGPEKYKTI